MSHTPSELELIELLKQSDDLREQFHALVARIGDEWWRAFIDGLRCEGNPMRQELERRLIEWMREAKIDATIEVDHG